MISVGAISSYLGLGAASHVASRLAVYGWRAWKAKSDRRRAQARVDDLTQWLEKNGNTELAEQFRNENKS